MGAPAGVVRRADRTRGAWEGLERDAAEFRQAPLAACARWSAGMGEAPAGARRSLASTRQQMERAEATGNVAALAALYPEVAGAVAGRHAAVDDDTVRWLEQRGRGELPRAIAAEFHRRGGTVPGSLAQAAAEWCADAGDASAAWQAALDQTSAEGAAPAPGLAYAAFLRWMDAGKEDQARAALRWMEQTFPAAPETLIARRFLPAAEATAAKGGRSDAPR